MTVLSPWSALIAAAVAIPLLLLLYVLKLRRRPQRVASTLLWRSVHEDLQVNAPFQRLRWSTLLALQLLAMALILFAYADPISEGDEAPAGRMILVIDQSASMNTQLPDGSTRLELARQQASQIIDRLGRSDQPARCMIIAYASTARVLTSFQSDRAMLRAAIDSIQPTDEPADLQQALTVAGAFAQQADEAMAIATPPPRIVLLSDGCVGEPDGASGFQLLSGSLQFIAIGADADASAAAATGTASSIASQSNNLGFTAFAAERDFEDPVRVRLFLRLSNASSEAIRTVLTITPQSSALQGGQQADDPFGSAANDASAAIVRTVTVPPAGDTGPGQLGITLEMTMPDGAVLLARHSHRDALPADDTAALVLPAANPPRIALVHPADAQPDGFLTDLIQSIDTETFDVLTADAFAALDTAQLDTGRLYDFVVFNRVPPQRLPGVPSLSIGGVPTALDVIEPRDQRGQRAATWDRQHPVMRYVELDQLIFAGFGAFDLPPAATTLASGPLGPIIAQIRSRGARHVLVGFELQRSNWPIDVSFTVFFLNVLDQALLGRSGRQGLAYQPGEVITVRALPDSSSIDLVGPIERSARVPEGSATQSVTLPRLTRTGLYAVNGANVPLQTLAVSLRSEQESDNRVRQTLRINAEQQVARSAGEAAPRPWWQWLVAAAAGVLIIEWLLWCLKHGVWRSAPRQTTSGMA